MGGSIVYHPREEGIVKTKQELEFHGISTVTVGQEEYVTLSDVQKLLDIYNQESLGKARVEVQASRLIEATELQAKLLSALGSLADKVEKYYGTKKKARKVLDKTYSELAAISAEADELKDAPPIA